MASCSVRRGAEPSSSDDPVTIAFSSVSINNRVSPGSSVGCFGGGSSIFIISISSPTGATGLGQNESTHVHPSPSPAGEVRAQEHGPLQPSTQSCVHSGVTPRPRPPSLCVSRADGLQRSACRQGWRRCLDRYASCRCHGVDWKGLKGRPAAVGRRGGSGGSFAPPVAAVGEPPSCCCTISTGRRRCVRLSYFEDSTRLMGLQPRLARAA